LLYALLQSLFATKSALVHFLNVRPAFREIQVDILKAFESWVSFFFIVYPMLVAVADSHIKERT